MPLQMHLTYESIPLPWRNCSKRGFNGDHQFAEIKGPVEIFAYTQPYYGYADIRIRGGLLQMSRASQRFWGQDMDQLKRLCEEHAGLFVAALGLARPGEVGNG